MTVLLGVEIKECVCVGVSVRESECVTLASVWYALLL